MCGVWWSSLGGRLKCAWFGGAHVVARLDSLGSHKALMGATKTSEVGAELMRRRVFYNEQHTNNHPTTSAV